MATSSILDVDIHSLLRKAERLTKTKLPREVVEVTLEPSLNTLCIRFKKPLDEELGEPSHPQIHIFRDRRTEEITALEILETDELLERA